MDAVQAANSGHPGAPMGMADICEVLWNDFLRHNPANPQWVNRDRFILSNGHGSMLLYALLHLSGYDLPMTEIKRFRQLHSRTPGHPEYGETPGVETTTGPLGQGLANAVGMAIAERALAAEFNRDGVDIVDHRTYVCVGDGCLMEGISHEACSLAGTLGLGKLIAIYDDNGISIDGEVSGWFKDDTPQRFEAYGWQVIRNVDGHDADAVAAALNTAQSEGAQPTLVCCKTVIGSGAPNKQGTADCHGAALGEEEVALTRENIGWEHPPFAIPEAIYAGWDARQRGASLEDGWRKTFARYRETRPQLAAEFERRTRGDLPETLNGSFADFVTQAQADANKVATRKASQNVLNAIGPLLPELMGGSADLTGSNGTLWKGSHAVTHEDSHGNYIYYGVREFAMSAIMNGLALHGGYIPYGGTFLVFSDYARNALRLAALMRIRSIFVYTHDSIGLGEDGPTHQAVEHVASLRLIPNMSVWRPCDEVETAVAWQAALQNTSGPTALILTRQGVPPQARSAQQQAAMQRGAYILLEPGAAPTAIIIATGSEVSLAVQAAQTVNERGHSVRVVAMPSTDTFDAQDADYRESVLPASITCRMAVEAAATGYWHKYVGTHGRIIGIDTYGASAPSAQTYAHFGFTAQNVIDVLEALL